MENCRECGEKLFGRVDKKFCNDGCRNAHNNRTSGTANNYMRSVNRQLAKNRKLLLSFNPDSKGKVRVMKNTLKSKGYDFNLHTSMYINKSGGQYFFCYDQGYIELEGDLLLLVKKLEE
jgi:hypothetical protein